MQPRGFTNLGGIDKPIDSRDVKLGVAAMPVYTFTPTLTNTQAWAMPVECQGDRPACGAHAGGALEGITRKSRFSPRFTWWDIKQNDGFGPNDGTDLRSVMKSITKTGVLDFALMGNDVTFNNVQYALPAISQAMLLNAVSHRTGYGYGFINNSQEYSAGLPITFDGLKQFIYDHGPAIILVRVGNEWWTAKNGVSSWHENDILPLRVPSPVVSGHYVVAHSYDEQYIYFLNSWSDSWGRKGHGYLGKEYMPYVNDAAALFPLVFPKDLSFGMTDPDVRHLQRVFNADPRTRVALTGPGSPGFETDYFGVLTKAAVVKFQALHSISPQSGYVGPLTRAVLNSVAPF